jgi:hypothetical protein
MMNKRTFSPEFKMDSASLVANKGYSVTEACQAVGVQAMSLVIHGSEPGLVLAHDLWLKAAVAVKRDIDIECAILGEQRFAGIAIAAISIAGWLVPVIAKRVIQLGIERGFNRDFLQHRTEITEVFF